MGIVKQNAQIGRKSGMKMQKHGKICKNAHFLDTFIVGACLNSRKYMSRIFC